MKTPKINICCKTCINFDNQSKTCTYRIPESETDFCLDWIARATKVQKAISDFKDDKILDELEQETDWRI